MTIQRRFLRGSAWTRVDEAEGERHFAVTDVPKGDTVVLRAVLTKRELRVELAALEDPTRWSRGWIPCP